MRHFDLAIIGTGSANSIPGPDFDDWSIAILEKGLFGGTCTNVGCIPTKMFVWPAELATGTVEASRFGVDASLDKVHWPAIRDRIFGRIDAIEAGGREYRSGPRTPNQTVYTGTARFLDAHTIDTGTGETITADRIVIGAGGRPLIPDIPGLDDATVKARVHTSDTVMRIDDLPGRLLIIGGGYIASEFAHVFASFGTTVIQAVRGDRLLAKHDRDVSEVFTTDAGQRYDLRLNSQIAGLDATADGITATLDGPDGESTLDVDLVLIATGRTPNSDLLDAEAAGLELHKDGRIKVDAQQRTNVDGIWALGDISSHYALKHVANAEARTVAHNLRHPDALVATDHRFVPAAVFGHPQVASVGLTEDEAVRHGVRHVVKTQQYGDIAAGWAREDTTHFAKLIADPASGRLLGAHIIGPEAATVIQPLIQAMSFGQSVRGLARGQYWIHPALPELIENALLGLELDPEPADDRE
ncbi:mycothione reductase [Nakamurella deserti]|uniref:mycothione reductase n=1 Tax=Nakamurella deserti TaxID=2164074 RepID=UPI000DBE1394|nr:mycothione reductase [Nakamurella deserti]